jgi:EAL domain-containing protein (putative c-di-GMP-specific phosphodiesterase class I)
MTHIPAVQKFKKWIVGFELLVRWRHGNGMKWMDGQVKE